MLHDTYIYCYKYLPFDEGSLSVIRDSTLKYTSAYKFNDPFDCLPTICERSVDRYLKFKTEMMDIHAQRAVRSPAKRIEFKRRQKLDVRKYLTSGDHLNSILNDTGIVCLSTIPKNILMWSHYANYHQGFVCEFKIKIYAEEDLLVSAKKLIAFPINYKSQRPVHTYDEQNEVEILKKFLLTKYEIWHYEKEYRVLDFERGPGIHYYDRDNLLVGVIAGAKMHPKDFSALSKEVEKLQKTSIPELKLYKAEMSKAHYEIEIPNFLDKSD